MCVYIQCDLFLKYILHPHPTHRLHFLANVNWKRHYYPRSSHLVVSQTRGGACLCWYYSSNSVFWKSVPQFFSSLINLDKSKKGVLNQNISRLHQLHFKHPKILFYKWTIKFKTLEIFKIKLLYPHNYHHTQW